MINTTHPPKTMTGTDWSRYTLQCLTIEKASVNIPASGYVDIGSINGKGLFQQINLYLSSFNAGLSLVIDGVEYNSYYVSSANAMGSSYPGGHVQDSSKSNPASCVKKLVGNIGFSSSLIIRVRNAANSITTTEYAAQITYQLAEE